MTVLCLRRRVCFVSWILCLYLLSQLWSLLLWIFRHHDPTETPKPPQIIQRRRTWQCDAVWILLLDDLPWTETFPRRFTSPICATDCQIPTIHEKLCCKTPDSIVNPRQYDNQKPGKYQHEPLRDSVHLGTDNETHGRGMKNDRNLRARESRIRAKIKSNQKS